MRCKMCGEKAVIKLKAYNLSLCTKCFDEFILRRVQKAIKDYYLIENGQKVMVAVSGGKDSLSLWHILHRLGYKTKGLYIQLGINEYSEKSEKFVKNFASLHGLEIQIENVREYFNGYGIKDISKIVRRPACSVCGMIKRYIMNKVAYEGEFILATGHNLDDEVATLLNNVLDWKTDYLGRQTPNLSSKDKLVQKIKPLVLCTEREMASYAINAKIKYIRDECPFSVGATSIFYKQLLNQLEEHSPGSKLRFYKNFLKVRYLFQTEEPELHPCDICGYPTTGKICNFCKLRERIVSKATISFSADS